jgi:hypothetical protein
MLLSFRRTVRHIAAEMNCHSSVRQLETREDGILIVQVALSPRGSDGS